MLKKEISFELVDKAQEALKTAREYDEKLSTVIVILTRDGDIIIIQ